MTALIKSLFDKKIDRRIEEVIKVDQTQDEILRSEIDEYIATEAIRRHYLHILEPYRETPNKPHEGIGVWVSGFFGSGKSSFAKMLGLAIENHKIEGDYAADLFGRRTGDAKIQVLLKTINEHIPAHAVIFDVSTDRGIRSGNQTLTEIMYGLFLQSLGYAKDLDLSELEIALEEKGELARFEQEYSRLFEGKQWKQEKGKVAFALSEASRVMHSLEPATYPMADSWVKAVKNKADITPGKLGDRANQLMKRRKPDHNLLFVIDEVGQFVARDVQKMLDLQAVVQSLGVRGRGKHWLVVTSQEQLGELVSGLDDKKIELARLMDRFPLQVHLEPSDISEVTSRRVLSKNAGAQTILGKLYDEHRHRLADATRLTADFKLPELTRDGFVDLYPLLPYQIDLIIAIVHGLRTAGGASKHVGGANRTIIKLAQQLLIHQGVDLGDRPVGELARLDHVYDLVEGNIASEVRAKITAIPKELDHPLAQPVAKVICLLQSAKSVHRTAENIAAALHPEVTASSRLAEVKDALRELEAAGKVRRGDDGYRIPTPAEDDWERVRNAISPRPGDAHRTYAEVLDSFWKPQPSFTLYETKTFKAGLAIHGRETLAGDLVFQFYLADEPKLLDSLSAELRARSQQERKSVFWAAALTTDINREIVEVFRSREMLSRKQREVRSDDRTRSDKLVAEEKRRESLHYDELKRLLKTACLTGSVYFQGEDRSPGDRAVDVGKSASEILGLVLPKVFDRYKEAAARGPDVKKAFDALMTAENLQGLPSLFSTLSLVREEKGKTVFRVDSGPLAEVLRRIEDRANYGDTASGRYLTDELAKEPFGWEFDVVRLLVLCLLRAGKIDATSKGQVVDSATSTEAKGLFKDNNPFRQAAFRPKKSIEFEELIKAAEAFRDTFGGEVSELNAGSIASELRREVARHEDTVASALGLITAHRLPGAGVLQSATDQMKVILRSSDESTIATFNSAHRSIKDAIKRGAELEQALTEPRVRDLERARRVMEVAWPFLKDEPDLTEALRSQASALADLLAQETFYRSFPSMEQHTYALEMEYERRYGDALQARIDAYTNALARLVKAPGWGSLSEDTRGAIAAPFEAAVRKPDGRVSIPLLRSERDACDGRLRKALQQVRHAIDGERVVSVSVSGYFADGVETEEQLDAALSGLREECTRLIGAGKKVIIQ